MADRAVLAIDNKTGQIRAIDGVLMARSVDRAASVGA